MYGFDDVVRAGNDGSGQTIALVDAWVSPTLLADAQRDGGAELSVGAHGRLRAVDRHERVGARVPLDPRRLRVEEVSDGTLLVCRGNYEWEIKNILGPQR